MKEKRFKTDWRVSIKRLIRVGSNRAKKLENLKAEQEEGLTGLNCGGENNKSILDFSDA